MNVKIVVVLIIFASTSSCSVAEKAKSKLTYKQAELLSVPQDANRVKATFFDEANTVYSKTRCKAGGDCMPHLKNIGTAGYMDIYHEDRVGQVEPDISSTDSTPEDSERSGITISQSSVYPDNDLDLIQLPHESNYQAVNSLRTSELPNNSEIDQKAEYRNVIFNQLDSPDALHTINSVRHDDPQKAGGIKQHFKFKSVEMIQRNVGAGIHSMNYMGD